jgi:hypothetical protein
MVGASASAQETFSFFDRGFVRRSRPVALRLETWPNHTERLLQGTVWAATERQGRGNVVMISGDLLFRGFWRGPAKLLTNAMLFGSGR